MTNRRFWQNGRFLTAVLPPIFLLFLLAQFVFSVANTAVLPDGSLVVRVYYNEIADIDQLASFDLWEMNNLNEQYVLVATDAAGVRQIERMGFTTALEPELTQTNQAAPDDFFSGYRTVDELYADLAQLEANYPDLAELFVYGSSHCQQQAGCTMPDGRFNAGYDLQAIRISNETIDGTSTISGTTVISGTKPVFFLMSGIHAREITTPELTMRMAQWLLDGYGTNADATWLVDYHEIWLVPTANPDGHWIVEQGEDVVGSPLFHRKNSNQNNGCNVWPSSSGSHFGTDLNRNHSHQWGGASTSTSPCSALYRGTASVSEPETAELETLVASLIPDQRGTERTDAAPANTMGLFISIHSFSELILYPWGYTGFYAPNRDGLKAIAEKMARYNDYLPCQPASCLYAASGTSDDFAYGKLGVPSFTFEVGTQFFPPYEEVDAVQWPDNGPAFQYAAKIARTPYQLVEGPDVLSPTVTLLADKQVSLTAVLDDSQNGNQPIQTLSYTIDTPYWDSKAVSQTVSLNAATPTATLNETLDLTPLSPDQHTLFLRAQDGDGNWGPVTAVFIDLTNTETEVELEVIYLPLLTNE